MRVQIWNDIQYLVPITSSSVNMYFKAFTIYNALEFNVNSRSTFTAIQHVVYFFPKILIFALRHLQLSIRYRIIS